MIRGRSSSFHSDTIQYKWSTIANKVLIDVRQLSLSDKHEHQVYTKLGNGDEEGYIGRTIE